MLPFIFEILHFVKNWTARPWIEHRGHLCLPIQNGIARPSDGPGGLFRFHEKRMTGASNGIPRSFPSMNKFRSCVHFFPPNFRHVTEGIYRPSHAPSRIFEYSSILFPHKCLFSTVFEIGIRSLLLARKINYNLSWEVQILVKPSTPSAHCHLHKSAR